MIKLHNLKKTYGSLVAVNDVSLEIKSGEMFGLLGPNGAGKTTLISMIIGLLKPSQGRVEIADGLDPSLAECRSKIGIAPQDLALYEELTGRENLDFFGKLQKLPKKALKSRVDHVLEFVALKDRAKDLVKTYSGGMKRRLNMAAALIHDPPLLLMDEPTVGVDPQSRNAIFENILALKDQGRTLVYTTHYMEEAQRLCDRVGIIDRGEILATDTVEGLIKAHGGKNTLTVELEGGEKKIETDEPYEELKQLEKTSKFLSFRVDRPNLEQVFLNMTGRNLRD